MASPRGISPTLLDRLSNASLRVARRWQEFYGRGCPDQWRFQKPIVNLTFSYVAAAVTEKEPRAAVIKMPTGTGKTAIMALLVNYCPKVARALIVVPSEGLKDQVRDYIGVHHWLKTTRRPPNVRKAEVFEPSGLHEVLEHLEQGEVTVAVCTTKTLGDIHRSPRYRDLYDRLRNAVQLVIVDEGHREPAKTWSKAVREMQRPVVLFTATPYRNDLRFFHIGSTRAEVTYHEAVEIGCIRRVSFLQKTRQYAAVDPKTGRWTPDLSEFLASLQAAVKEIMRNCAVDYPKIIVRCHDDSTIEALTKRLNTGFTPVHWGLKKRHITGPDGDPRPIAIGLHDQFSGAQSAHRYKSLGSILRVDNRDRHAIFWIHQNKLTEGIDDPDFVLISFCQPFSNARSLVQQIGRVIRRPAGSAQTECFVHAQSSFKLDELWRGYLDYEQVNEEGKAQRIYGTEEIVRRITHAFPGHFYFSDRFAKVLSSELTQNQLLTIVGNDLRVPRATTVFQGSADRDSIESWLNNLSEWLLDQDVIELTHAVRQLESLWTDVGHDGYLGVYLGYEIKPSQYLSESLFFDISMLACTLLSLRGYVFFRGNSVSWVDDIRGSLRRLSSRDMRRLAQVAETEGYEIKQVGLVHSDPGRYTKRRRVEGGRNLIETAPFIDDHLHAMTSLVCKLRTGQRYLGLTRGRITDDRGTFIAAKDYVEWAGRIVDQLESDNGQHNYFRRFAEPVDAPVSPRPRHLLCDLRQFRELLESRVHDGTHSPLEEAFEEQAVVFGENGASSDDFTLEQFATTERNVHFKLDYRGGRFHLVPKSSTDRDELSKIFGSGAAKAIKDNVILRLIVETADEAQDLFYTDDQFFCPSAPLWGKDRIGALGTLHGLSVLLNTDCEKEQTGYLWPDEADTWPPTSVFRLIDQMTDSAHIARLNSCLSDGPVFFVPEVIFCPDSSEEIADFVLYSRSENKLVAVHAKQAKVPLTTSAVGFAKIQEQIIKNLRIFDPAGMPDEEWTRQFDGDWKAAGKTASGGELALPKLRKRAGKTRTQILADLRRLTRHGADKEVWVFYGAGFSSSEFLKQLKKESPKYWLRHLAYLLVNANSAVSRAGAKLRVFTTM